MVPSVSIAPLAFSRSLGESSSFRITTIERHVQREINDQFKLVADTSRVRLFSVAEITENSAYVPERANIGIRTEYK
jgi:hypothetical protein